MAEGFRGSGFPLSSICREKLSHEGGWEGHWSRTESSVLQKCLLEIYNLVLLSTVNNSDKACWVNPSHSFLQWFAVRSGFTEKGSWKIYSKHASISFSQVLSQVSVLLCFALMLLRSFWGILRLKLTSPPWSLHRGQ